MPSDTLLEALVTGQKKRNAAPYSAGEGGKEGTGRWGEPTGLIDWCEPNYALTSDVAELHNTWSNVFYVLVGAAVLARCQRLRLPLQFHLCGAFIVLTGVFSAAFHASLWLSMQRLDEIFENGILIAMLYSDRGSGKEGGLSAVAATVLHFIVCAALILSVGQFLFCELHLVGIILLVLAKFQRLTRAPPRRRGKESNNDDDRNERGDDPSAPVRPLVGAAAAWTVAGFACWLLDRLACDAVGAAQLHAWWHLCTALALWWGFKAISMVHLHLLAAKAPIKAVAVASRAAGGGVVTRARARRRAGGDSHDDSRRG
jgi:dihydroceramidase